MAQLEPYVRYGIGRAKRDGDLGFELRIPAGLVFTLYKMLCEELEVETDVNPLMATYRETLASVRDVLAVNESKSPTMGRRRK
jgi:hypothetical protein